MYESPQYLKDTVARIADGREPQVVDVDSLVDFHAVHKDQVSLAVDCARRLAAVCPDILHTYARGTRANGNLRVSGIDAETGWLRDDLAAAIAKEADEARLARLRAAKEAIEAFRSGIARLRSAA